MNFRNTLLNKTLPNNSTLKITTFWLLFAVATWFTFGIEKAKIAFMIKN